MSTLHAIASVAMVICDNVMVITGWRWVMPRLRMTRFLRMALFQRWKADIMPDMQLQII